MEAGTLYLDGMVLRGHSYALKKGNFDKLNVLEINGTEFVENTYPFQIIAVSNVDLKDSLLMNNRDVMSVTRVSSFSVFQTVFLNNTYYLSISDSGTIIDDSYFELHQTNANAGALSVSSGNCQIRKTLFDSNSGNKAGAIYTSNSAMLSIQDTSFVNNKGDAGGIFCNNAAGNIFNSEFTGNQGQKAGAVYCERNCQLFFQDTHFENNEPEWSNPSCQP